MRQCLKIQYLDYLVYSLMSCSVCTHIRPNEEWNYIEVGLLHLDQNAALQTMTLQSHYFSLQQSILQSIHEKSWGRGEGEANIEVSVLIEKPGF